MFELRISRRMLAEIIVDRIVYLGISIFTKEVLPNFFKDWEMIMIIYQFKRMFMLIEDL